MEFAGRQHAVVIGFRPKRLGLGNLPEDLQCPTIHVGLRQVCAEVHQVGRILGELGGRHDRPIDLLLRLARGLHAQRQDFIHPGLGLIVPQRGLDQRDDLLVLLRGLVLLVMLDRLGNGFLQLLDRFQHGLLLLDQPGLIGLAGLRAHLLQLGRILFRFVLGKEVFPGLANVGAGGEVQLDRTEPSRRPVPAWPRAAWQPIPAERRRASRLGCRWGGFRGGR